MSFHRLLVLISDPVLEPWAQKVFAALAPSEPLMLVGTPAAAAQYLSEQRIEPSEIILDIGMRGADIIPEIDALAEQCVAGTRVVVVGQINDIKLYRALTDRGVLDYVPMPAAPADLLRAFAAPVTAPALSPKLAQQPAPGMARDSKVITFMSAASGDGASTLALNTAAILANLLPGNTVLVDMDYQYGMVAKNLNLQTQYGIRELFEHPDRGVDQMLIKRMVVRYGKLNVIAAPAELKFLPPLDKEAIIALIDILKQSFDTIILDLPHVWQEWVATAIGQANHTVLVSQLWLKSVTHAARFMKVWREMGVTNERVSLVVNRSGAKFKEAIETGDLERVCGLPIRRSIANDIKTITEAEAQAKPVYELGASKLGADLDALARTLVGERIVSESQYSTEAPKSILGVLGKLTRKD